MVDDMKNHFIRGIYREEKRVFHIHWPSGMKTTMRYHYLFIRIAKKVGKTPTFSEVEEDANHS